MILDVSSENLRRSLSKIPLHRVFFVFFLFSLPFSIRKVLAVFSSDGVFNEYLDVSIYLSDLLLIVTLLTFILGNKFIILSIAYWRKMFHVEHLLLPIFIPGLFILWSGLSVFWSESLYLALAAFFHLVLSYGLYLYILICNVPRGTKSKEPLECSTWNILQVISNVIVASAVFQSVIAILQFISQKSLSLSFLRESVFSIYDPGVAKIMINGELFVRAYGFFPHPNVLGGFLMVSVLITILRPFIFKYRLFHVEQSDQNQHNVPRGTIYERIVRILKECSTWNKIRIMVIATLKKMFHVEQVTNFWLYRGIISIQLLALFLTFSKSAVLAFIIGFFMVVLKIQKMFHVEQSDQNQHNVPRGTIYERIVRILKECSTWNKIRIMVIATLKKMFHVEHPVLIAGGILSLIVLFSFNIKLFITQPFAERLFYMRSLHDLTKSYFFEGLGIGQFVFDMQQFFDETLHIWQFQPIHNVFLLIFSEVGVVGLSLFLWFLLYIFFRRSKNVPRGTIGSESGECSTWNNPVQTSTPMFHVEQFSENNRNAYLDSDKHLILSHLYRVILVGIVLIMFFDHYFWDIQQGRLLLWIVLALAILKRT